MVKRAVLLTMLAALATAGQAGATGSVAPIRVVVVGAQHGTLLVASADGFVQAVRGRAAIGARVLVRGVHLTKLGRAHSALLRGVVVRHTGSLTFLSAAQHVLVVRTGRRLASARDTSPQPGAVVQETVKVDDQGELEQENEQELGLLNRTQIQATIASIGTGTVTLTVNGQSLTIPLPAGLTLPATLVGTQVTLNVSFANGQAVATDDDQADDDNAKATTTTGTGVLVPSSGGDHHGDGGGDG